MNKKCEIEGCIKFVRKVFRLGETLIYTCNGHYSDLLDRYEEIERKVSQMTEEEMIARLEELNRIEERIMN